MTMPIITLTTDFGLDDCYVGVMKGVILSRAPSAIIIDLTHSIAPQDILQAANLIHANFSYFPTGTMHVVVVDPGVGSDRKIILAEACGHRFLAPDNGVLSHFILKNQISRAFYADKEELYLTPTSHTFHGRDIFAPLTAFLANGNPLESIGPICTKEKLMALDLPTPKINSTQRTIEGMVMHIDRFGNLATNITLNELNTCNSPETISVTINGHRISGLQKNYRTTGKGLPLLLINSQNCLEIAVNQGNAQTLLNTSLYDTVLLST